MPPLVDTLLVADSEPRSVYMWPEVGAADIRKPTFETFVFQYWPESISDSESPRWSTKEVPGASHPLYQWTGGGEREISFAATFTAEVDSFSRFQQAVMRGGRESVIPSARYTVDVAAAIAKIKTYIRGEYNQNSLNQATLPPKRLWLVLENSKINGESDAVLTILKSAPVTYEAFFPNGSPRVASVQMTFAEVVQKNRGVGETSQIAYLGRSSFKAVGDNYSYRGTVDRVNG